MKLPLITVTALLIGRGIAASPAALQEKLRLVREERKAQRSAARRARPDTYYERSIESVNTITFNDVYAGAVQNSKGISVVTAAFNVPNPKVPAGGSKSNDYSSSAWVAIDGINCNSASFMTGVNFATSGGETIFSGFYEWYPAFSHHFDGFAVKVGNEIKATVHAISKTAGTATLENLTTGKTVNHTFTDQSAVGSLCLSDADWIVKNNKMGHDDLPFANFGTVTFGNASYTDTSGTHGVNGAGILEVKENNKIVTNCTLPTSGSVKCTYV